MSTEQQLNAMRTLQDFIRPRINWSFPLQTRVHALHSFKRLNSNVFVKRDDETGFGIGGSKFRKYASLIPFLKDNNFQEVVAIGGAYSNNMVGLGQMLNEAQIDFHLFLRGESKQTQLIGNHLLIRLLTKLENIHWIGRNDWDKVTIFAQEFSQTRRDFGFKTIVVPEGASMNPSAYGMLTLPLDILRNEQVSNIQFEHIVLDSGTGMTASLTILAFLYLGIKRKFYVVLTAGNEQSFKFQFETWANLLSQQIGRGILPTNFESIEIKFIQPESAFGRTNAKTFENIKDLARNEGIFTDPIYSSKLFEASRKAIDTYRMAGNVLIVHSGGGTGIFGFGQELSKTI